jgi:hypothetical protein
MATVVERRSSSSLLPTPSASLVGECERFKGSWHLMVVWGHGLEHYRDIVDLVHTTTPAGVSELLTRVSLCSCVSELLSVVIACVRA